MHQKARYIHLLNWINQHKWKTIEGMLNPQATKEVVTLDTKQAGHSTTGTEPIIIF